MRWLLPVLTLLLASCTPGMQAYRDAQQDEAAAQSVVPQNHKAEIVALMRTYLNDPVGVRGAFASEPAMRTIDGTSRYTVCLRYNARKSPGQYAGSKDSIILFRQGKLERIVDNARELCKDAAYQPFPELERMTR
jgi:hypothetical protein